MDARQQENMKELTKRGSAMRHAIREYTEFWHLTKDSFGFAVISPTMLADETIEIVMREKEAEENKEQTSPSGYRVPPHT